MINTYKNKINLSFSWFFKVHLDEQKLCNRFVSNVMKNHNEIEKIFGSDNHLILEISDESDKKSIYEYYLNKLEIKASSLEETKIFFDKLSKLFEDDSLLSDNRITADCQYARKGQKVSKYIINMINDVIENEDTRKSLNRMLSEIIEKYSSMSKKYYLRIGWDAVDYLTMGVGKGYSSCTALYSDETNSSNYMKAIFTYMQLPTFVATIYENKADAVARTTNSLARQVYYYNCDEKVFIGMRQYGHQKAMKQLITKGVFNFLKDQGIISDYKYFSNLNNRKLINSLYNYRKNDYSTQAYGYIDTLHYPNYEGHNLMYTPKGIKPYQLDLFSGNEYDYTEDLKSYIKADYDKLIGNTINSIEEHLNEFALFFPYNIRNRIRYLDEINFNTQEIINCEVIEAKNERIVDINKEESVDV